MSSIEQYLIFSYAAEAGSFSQAAERLGVSNSHISKHIARLEQRLGYALFHRRPRLQLTESGAALLPGAMRMIEGYQALVQVATGLNEEVAGVVRISLPSLLAREGVVPKLAGFMQQHPGLKIELTIQQPTLESFSDNMDLIVTLGSLPDSSLISQRIGQCEVVLAAAPDYLREKGAPATPEELARHACVVSHFPHFEQPSRWQLSGRDQSYDVAINSPLVCNDMGTVKELTADALGIGVLLKFCVEEDFRAGNLVPVLEDYHFPYEPPVYMVFRERELMPKRVSLVKAFLEDSIGQLLGRVC